MEKLNGLKCRECDRRYPAGPVHVCEFCFGPLEVDYRYDVLKSRVTRESIEAGVIDRGDSVVICITGNGLKTPDVLTGRVPGPVMIKPSLSAFDRALADLKSQTS